jgi:hypothetical protein
MYRNVKIAWKLAFALLFASTLANAVTLSPPALPNGVVGVAYAPSISASGGTAPYSYLIVAPTQPTGVSLNGLTGVFSGTPTVAGVYTFVIRVLDASGTPTDFTETVTIAATPVQTITFPAIPDHFETDRSVQLVATGGLSSSPVIFASSTPSVCNVNGALAVLTGSLGVCTITATQAGDGTFNAAVPVSRSFNVIEGLQDPPTGVSCSAKGRNVSCSFVPPVSNGSPVVASYSLRCVDNASNAFSTTGSTSPITLADLAVGLTYSCSVASQNVNGTGPYSSPTSVLTYSTLALRGQIDSDGDGRGELWARSGNIALKFRAATSGLLFSSNAAILDLQSTVLGFGDFASLGRSAILLQNQSGDVRVNFGADGAPDGDAYSRNVKSGWRVDAIGDLDGDGKSDIVWRYASPDTPDTGVVYVWFMNGASVNEVKARGGAPLSWRLVGAADLDGDGMADLIWQSPSGDLRSLTAKAGRSFVNEKIGTVPSGFNLIAAADIDGDGKADLIFRNSSTGEVQIWMQNGLQTTATYSLPSVDSAWQFVTVSDLNGDGAADLIWLAPGNTFVVWYMNGANLSAPTAVYSPGVLPDGYQLLR